MTNQRQTDHVIAMRGRTQELIEQEKAHHYFATHAMGWVTADTEAEAIEKLMLKNTDPSWVRNCLKSGEPLVFFTCRIPLASDASYKIEWFVPQVEGITEAKNYLVTYLTKTKFAVMRDPRDEIKKLKAELSPSIEKWIENAGADRTDLMQQLAIDIQHTISTPELADLIEELGSLYEPLED